MTTSWCHTWGVDNFQVNVATPEPSTWLLVGTGFLPVLVYGRLRRRHAP